MAAYYNEHDRFAATWLRELIKDGQIADGEVDERDIQDVTAADVRGFTRCHFFAGIGGWDYALQLAGWPADRPVWTGSCPCQPFSSAGKNVGGADDRHLWPHWARLIRECRPDTILGEQVESAIAHGWLDAVVDDLERDGYTCGAACLPAASVGAFHRRQRLWFVAHTDRRHKARRGTGRGDSDSWRAHGELAGSGAADNLADTERGTTKRQRHDMDESARRPESRAQERERLRPDVGHGGDVDRMAESESESDRTRGSRSGTEGIRAYRRELDGGSGASDDVGDPDDTRSQGRHERGDCAGERTPWAPSLVRWHFCRDGKRRPVPVEPAFFPVVDGLSPGRVGLLRGAGNAIIPQVAEAFIRAYLDTEA